MNTMDKNKLRRQLEMIECLEENMEDILKDSILFGSRLWGVESEDSDYDYLIDNEYQLTSVLRVCKDLELPMQVLEGGSGSEEHRMYNTNNIKVQFNGKMLNFIAYDKGDLRIIKYDILPRMNVIDRNLIRDKRIRVMIFNGLLDIFLGETYEFVNKKQKFIPLPIINIDEDDIPFGY